MRELQPSLLHPEVKLTVCRRFRSPGQRMRFCGPVVTFGNAIAVFDEHGRFWGKFPPPLATGPKPVFRTICGTCTPSAARVKRCQLDLVRAYAVIFRCLCRNTNRRGGTERE